VRLETTIGIDLLKLFGKRTLHNKFLVGIAGAQKGYCRQLLARVRCRCKEYIESLPFQERSIPEADRRVDSQESSSLQDTHDSKKHIDILPVHARIANQV